MQQWLLVCNIRRFVRLLAIAAYYITACNQISLAQVDDFQSTSPLVPQIDLQDLELDSMFANLFHGQSLFVQSSEIDGSARAEARLTHPTVRSKVSDFRPDVPRAVERLLGQLLAENPDDRPDSASKVAELLQPWTRGACLSELVAHIHSDGTPIESAKQSKKRSLKKRMYGRRAALAGIAVVGISVVAAPRISFFFSPRLQRSKWRELTPVAPELFLTLEAKDQVIYDTSSEGHIRVQSNDLALVHLGRPVTGVFALRVGLSQADWQGGVGIFFQGRHLVCDDGAIFEFQTIELRPPDRGKKRTVRRLLWSHWKAIRSEGKYSAKRSPWAEVAVQLSMSDDIQNLQVTFGRHGFPEVEWNEKNIHETAWKLSTEGRNQQQLSADQLPRAFLGKLGLANVKGSTFFIHPRLSYL